MMSAFAKEIVSKRYFHEGETTWDDVARRVVREVFSAVPAPQDLRDAAYELIRDRKFMPGGRYLASAGRQYHQTQNCFLARAEDSREGWADLVRKATLVLMTGGGFGVVYSALREKGAYLRRVNGTSSGPLALMQMINEVGRGAMAGGSRRAALWAGLRWDHPDIFDFIRMKDWSPEVHALKAKDFSFPAMMDHTNISVCLDDRFFEAYYAGVHRAREVYDAVMVSALITGEPGFSIDIGDDAGEDLRNPCTEITSHNTDDCCNLGSINLARIESLAEMQTAVEVGTAFLLAGTVYSDVPYPEVAVVRAKNRRLGLGLLGVHEFLLKLGRQYGPDDELRRYLEIYTESRAYAGMWSCQWGLSESIKTRAVAPTGTIGIVAETTTGAEPIFCAAYRRRYFDRGEWRAQYVLDPTARRLVAAGMNQGQIEDAYSIPVDRRLAMQAWIQLYVDHAISSTVNLPPWDGDLDRVQATGETLMQHLRGLRGVTFYPDGARGGQPLERCSWREAEGREGEVVVEGGDVCDLRGGTCGA